VARSRSPPDPLLQNFKDSISKRGLAVPNAQFCARFDAFFARCCKGTEDREQRTEIRGERAETREQRSGVRDAATSVTDAPLAIGARVPERGRMGICILSFHRKGGRARTTLFLLPTPYSLAFAIVARKLPTSRLFVSDLPEDREPLSPVPKRERPGAPSAE